MKKSLVTFLILACSYFQPAMALTTADEDYYRTIMVNGEDIPILIGKKIQDISLVSVIDGALEPIPYQIDEYNQGGAVYFDNWDEPIDGTRSIIDNNDKLLFLFGDSGLRKTDHMHADGEILAEIKLTTVRGNVRYVYVVEGSRLRSDAQHVRYSIEESQVETDFFSMKFDQDNQLIWKDFRYADYQGESPIDGLKINYQSGVMTSIAEVEFDNTNFVAKTVGENVGPIRTTTQLHLTFVFLGMNFIDASIQLHFYPNALIYDVRLVIPEMRRAMLVDPVMTIGVDFNNLIGAEAITSFFDTPLLVDGKMSEYEQQAQGTAIPPGQSGLLLRSNRGFDILTFLDWIGDTPLPTHINYADNTDFQGDLDRFKGQLPLGGYRISGFPESGLFGFVSSIYFSDNFKGKPKDLSKIVRTSPTITVNY